MLLWGIQDRLTEILEIVLYIKNRTESSSAGPQRVFSSPSRPGACRILDEANCLAQFESAPKRGGSSLVPTSARSLDLLHFLVGTEDN